MKTVTDSGYTHAQLYERYFRGLTGSGMDAKKARKRAREWAGEHDILVVVEEWFAVPEELEVSWQAETAVYEVILEDGVLHYYDLGPRSERRLKKKVRPTVEHWYPFLRTLNELDVWSWPEEFRIPYFRMHGMWWSVKVRKGEQQVNSRGYLVFPPGTNPDTEPDSPEWVAFCRAVSALVEGENFGGYVSEGTSELPVPGPCEGTAS